MNTLPFDKQVQIIAALCEGNSIRATERLIGVHRDTIMRLGLRVGQGCAELHDRMMRDLQVGVIQMDEQWAYIGKKQKRVRADDPREMGDVWLYIAFAANQKAIISYVIGKRNFANTDALAADLAERILNRPQITSDGYAPYIGAIDNHFGNNADYAQVVKIYETEPGQDAAHRYSPARVREVKKVIVRGNPDPDLISTSYVERMNLSNRMAMRRFARLTNAFSKKLENHRAAVALWVCFYNFCRVHEALGRRTPAMALGIADHIWNIGQLIESAAAIAEPEPTPPAPTVAPSGGLRLRLIQGGKKEKP
jgi:IS1 family transposase